MTDLDCVEFVELTTAYLDGALDAGTLRQVLDHLRACEGCARHLDQLRRTVAALGELPADPVPDSGSAAAHAAFRARRTAGP